MAWAGSADTLELRAQRKETAMSISRSAHLYLPRRTGRHVGTVLVGLVALALAAGCTGAGDRLGESATAVDDAVSTTTRPDVAGIPVDLAFCAAWSAAAGSVASTGSLDPSTIPATLEALTALQPTAPEQLAGDLAKVTATLQAAAPAIAALGSPVTPAPAGDGSSLPADANSEMLARLAGAGPLGGITDLGFQTALARISAYSQQRCA